MSLISGYAKAGEKINALFNESTSILHKASKGVVREFIVKDVIRPFLPKRFGLASGECFDRNDKKSKQLDCIIYDEMYAYRIPFGDAYSLFPCEAVYGNIEVKSKLDKKSFTEAINNIASLKRLKREPANEFDITPSARITINGMTPSEKITNSYFGVVFAFNSVEVETVFEYIKNAKIDIKLLPNMIVLYNMKTIFLPSVQKTVVLGDGHATGFSYVKLGDKINETFIALLITVLNSMNLRINPMEVKEFVRKTLTDKNIPGKTILL